MITSRSALPSPREVRRLPLGVLDADGSAELLRRTAGPERFAPDASAARRLAELLGHHPQALTVIGRHLRDHPSGDLADCYREPLTVLALHDMDTRTVAALADESVDRVRTHLGALVSVHLVQEVHRTAAASRTWPTPTPTPTPRNASR